MDEEKCCGLSTLTNVFYIFNIIFMFFALTLVIFGSISYTTASDIAVISQQHIITYELSIIQIVIGSVIFPLVFLGCYGAMKESHIVLKIFGIFLLIICMLELAVGVSASLNKDDLYWHLFQRKYEDLSKEIKRWDRIQTKFKCCGAGSYGEWGYFMPESCCTAETFAVYKSEYNCKRKLNTPNVYANPYYPIISLHYLKEKKLFMVFSIAIAFVPLVGMILSFLLAYYIKREING